MHASHVMEYISTISYTFITALKIVKFFLGYTLKRAASLYPCPYMYEHSTVLYGEPPP